MCWRASPPPCPTATAWTASSAPAAWPPCTSRTTCATSATWPSRCCTPISAPRSVRIGFWPRSRRRQPLQRFEHLNVSGVLQATRTLGRNQVRNRYRWHRDTVDREHREITFRNGPLQVPRSCENVDIRRSADHGDAARHNVLGRVLCSHTERQVTQRAQDACRVLDGRLDEARSRCGATGTLPRQELVERSEASRRRDLFR